MAFSPDGALLASAGGGEDPLKLWDVATRRQVGTLGRSRRINTISFSSPDGGRLATGSWDGQDHPVGRGDTRADRHPGSHADGVRSVAFSPDGAILASGGGHEDKTVKLWDVGTLEPIAAPPGRTYGSVESVAFAPGGDILASGAGDGIKLWDTATWEPIGALEGRGGNTVSFSHDGIMLASGSWRGVTLWDVANQKSHHYPGRTCPLGESGGLVSRPQEPGFRIGRPARSLLWDVTEWTGPPSLGPGDHLRGRTAGGAGGGLGPAPGGGGAGPVRQSAARCGTSPSPSPPARASSAGASRWSTQPPMPTAGAELPLTLGLHLGPNSVGVSIGGARAGDVPCRRRGYRRGRAGGGLPHLASASGRDGASGERRDGGKRPGRGPLGGRPLSGRGQRHRRVAVRGGYIPAQALLPTEGSVHSVSFSLDGTLAAGLDNGRVELWEVETGKRTGTLRHGDWGRVTVVFSRDGRSWASGSLEQVIKVWGSGDQRRDRRLGGAAGQRFLLGHLSGLLAGRVEAGLGVPGRHGPAVGRGRLRRRWPPWRGTPDRGGFGGVLARRKAPGFGWRRRGSYGPAVGCGHTNRGRHAEGTYRRGAFGVPFPLRRRHLGFGLVGRHGPAVGRGGPRRRWATLEEHAGRDSFGDVLARRGPPSSPPRCRRHGAAAGHGDAAMPAVSPVTGPCPPWRSRQMASFWRRDSRTAPIRLWDAATRTPTATLEGHTSRVGSVSFSSDGALLASRVLGSHGQAVGRRDPNPGGDAGRAQGWNHFGVVLGRWRNPGFRWRVE